MKYSDRTTGEVRSVPEAEVSYDATLIMILYLLRCKLFIKRNISGERYINV